MSKEKNLVFMNKGVPVVEGAKHRKLAHIDVSSKRPECVSCLCSTPLGIVRHKDELDAFIVGPAIDRLYEFEKLGMEPEEIEKQLKYLNVLSRCHENLLKDLAWYKGQHGVLQVQHSNQAASIRELFDENTKLREELRLVRSSIYGLAPAANKQLKTEIEELRNEIADRERVELNLRRHITNLEAIFEPNLTLQQVISQQRERINELKKELDSYKETAEMYREKCIELETKPLTVEEFEDYLDDLAKKYDLTAFKSTNGCIHNVIFTDTARGVYSGKRIVFDLYIDLNKFSGSKDIMKVAENNLREKLHLGPLEDDRA